MAVVAMAGQGPWAAQKALDVPCFWAVQEILQSMKMAAMVALASLAAVRAQAVCLAAAAAAADTLAAAAAAAALLDRLRVAAPIKAAAAAAQGALPSQE